MEFIIFSALAVQCSYEVVSPSSTCFDSRWLTHCLDNCHSINYSCLPGFQGNNVIGDIPWLQINTNFVWEVLKYSHQLAFVCAR